MMNVLIVVLLVVVAIIAWAIYQYKVEKKARQARYDKVRKRTDVSKPYHPLSNPSWPRGSSSVANNANNVIAVNRDYSTQHLSQAHHYHDSGSSSGSSDSGCSGGSSSSGGGCD